MNPLLIIIVGAIAALVLYEWAWARGEQSGRRVHAANYAALRKALATESPKPVIQFEFAIPDKSEPVILHEGDTVEVVFTVTRDDVPYKKLTTEVTLLDGGPRSLGVSLGVSTYVEDAS